MPSAFRTHSRPSRNALLQCVLVVVLLGTVSTTMFSREAFAEQDAPEETDSGLGEQAREQFRAWLTKTLERERLQHQNDQLLNLSNTIEDQAAQDPETLEHLLVTIQDDPEWTEELTKIVELSSKRYFEAVERVSERAEEQLQAKVTALEEIGAVTLERQQQTWLLKSQQSVQGQLVYLLGADNRWLWLLAFLSLSGVAVAIAWARRHSLRRLFWVRQNRWYALGTLLGGLLLLLLLPSILLFTFGNQTRDTLLRLQGGAGDVAPLTRWEQETSAIDNADLIAKNEQLRRDISEEADSMSMRLRPHVPEQTSELINDEIEHRLRLANLSTLLKTDDFVEQQLDEMTEAATEAEQELAAASTSLGDLRNRKNLFAALLCGLFLLLGAGLTVWFTRVLARNRRQTSRTCPLCLHQHDQDLEVITGRLGTPELMCTASYQTDQQEEICNFTFSQSYQYREKLSFPILGVASSGKTHWLAMTYWELNAGAGPDWVQFERLKSAKSDEFDELVQTIVQDRLRPGATRVEGIPHPLTFALTDSDPLGKSELLASVYDYAGKVTMEADHWVRRRALDAEGYFYFLDPTRDREGQVDALINFREDVRELQRAGQVKQLNRPVALCVSKMDLMVNQPYAEGGGLVEDFYKALDEIDDEVGSGLREMSLERFQRRSDVMLEYLPMIWPRWDIMKQLREVFGPRVMLFPMTPVGMNSPGEDDLERLTITTYGILEPFLWLLHMNGYPVLKAK